MITHGRMHGLPENRKPPTANHRGDVWIITS